jgi:hypothetical protein
VNDTFYAAVDEDENRILFDCCNNPTLLAMPCVDIEIIYDLIYMSHDGQDGTVFMLKSVLGFVLELYPTCKQIELSDTSGYIDRINGRPINLANRDMFLYKQTWYQRNFPFCNFKPKDKLAKQRIDELLKQLDTKLTKKACVALKLPSTYANTTLFEATATRMIRSNDVYGTIQKAMYYYGIPSLHGMSFIGNIQKTSDLNVTFRTITKPKPSKLKALCGGEHFRHVTWIQ